MELAISNTVAIPELNPLYIDTLVTNIFQNKHCLIIQIPDHRYEFEPHSIPYDSIIVQQNGSLSYAGMRYLKEHNVTFVLLDWRGDIVSQIDNEAPVSNALRIAQYKAYLNPEMHQSIASAIVQTKMERQHDLLQALKPFFDIDVPEVPLIIATDTDTIRGTEASYAESFFNEYSKICITLGYKFTSRHTINHSMRASSLVNSLLNYSYSILQSYIRRSLNACGLDMSIPFLHDLRNDRTGLVFDAMEIERCVAEHSVIQVLDELRRKESNYYYNEHYECMIKEHVIKLLVQKMKSNLTNQEMISNARSISNYILGKTKHLVFNLKPIDVRRSDTSHVKDLILTKYASQLKINRSTLWYQKKRLEQNGTVRMYSKTKKHFVK